MFDQHQQRKAPGSFTDHMGGYNLRAVFWHVTDAVTSLLAIVQSRINRLAPGSVVNRTSPGQIAAITVVLALNGCASLPGDLGRGDVDALVSERGHPIASVDPAALVAELTREPLTAERAIRLALINNPTMQATYAQLGFAAADIYEAGRIRNPILSGAILDSNRPGERDQVAFGLATSVTDLLTLPARKRLAAAEFAALKQSIGATVLATAADAEAAYYRYVGAKQVAALREQIAKAGGLSESLAKRYHDAGNLTPRDLALEQASAAEAHLAALSAQAEAYAMRTELATLLGLSVGAEWDAPAQLPVPLSTEDALNDLLILARECRLDLAAAQARTDIVADELGVANWTRWLGELDVGGERERETDGARLSGPTVDWELPIFNQHRDALLRLDARLQIALLEVARLALAVENDVHLAYTGMQNAKARVDAYRDRLVPARRAATARAQEEQNFMLIGIFELLVTKTQEYDAYQGYLEAVRDYWLARAALMHAVGSALPSSVNVGKDRLDVKDVIRPARGNDHSGHAMPMPEEMQNEHSSHGAEHKTNGGEK